MFSGSAEQEMQLYAGLYENYKIADIIRCGANEDGEKETAKDATLFY